jgi:hypothetical protein
VSIILYCLGKRWTCLKICINWRFISMALSVTRSYPRVASFLNAVKYILEHTKAASTWRFASVIAGFMVHSFAPCYTAKCFISIWPFYESQTNSLWQENNILSLIGVHFNFNASNYFANLIYLELLTASIIAFKQCSLCANKQNKNLSPMVTVHMNI